MFSGNLPREVDPERGAVEQGEGHGGGEADHQATTTQVSGDMGGGYRAVEQGEGHGEGEADHQATTSQVSGDMGGIE